MDIRFTTSVLFVKNIQLCRDFYEKVLGQEVDYDFGTCVAYKSGIALWKPDKGHPTRKIKKIINTKSQVELCFETENMDKVLKKLQGASVKYLHNLVEEPWGQRTIRIFDPEKNLIEIGESIRCFVRRMYDEGIPAETIAEKTGVPLTNVWEMVTD